MIRYYSVTKVAIQNLETYKLIGITHSNRLKGINTFDIWLILINPKVENSKSRNKNNF